MKAVMVSLALLLTACSGSDATASGADGPVTGEATAPAGSSSPRTSEPATAIRVSEETDRLDYELTIPAEAAALPVLKARLTREAEEARASTLAQQADYAQDSPDAGNLVFGVQHNWRVVGQTDRLLSLVLDVSGYTGGAHGSAGTVPLLWDRQADREVPLAALVTSTAKALATIRQPFCRALDKERLDKRGESMTDDGTSFTQCPGFDDVTVAPAGAVGGKFSRILVIADPYVAGPWAEGDYEIELVIPKAMVPLIAPPWASSFPG